MSNIKKMTVGDFKTHFSDAIDWVRSGKKIAVTFGKKKEVVGYFVPETIGSEEKRELGKLEGSASATFKDDFKITEEEFLG